MQAITISLPRDTRFFLYDSEQRMILNQGLGFRDVQEARKHLTGYQPQFRQERLVVLEVERFGDQLLSRFYPGQEPQIEVLEVDADEI